MRANDRTGRSPKSTSTDSNTNTSTTRRRLLGGAAALATIPATGAAEPAEGDDPDAVDTDDGSASYPSGEHSVWGSVELGEAIDEDTTIRVTGHAYDDEPASVALGISTTPAKLSLSLCPDRARAIAADLVEAADAAEGVE